MSDCIFCKIAAGEIPSACLYEDDTVFAFRDFLVIPKEHIASMNDVNAENAAVAAHCLEVIGGIAEKEGLKDGYRVISNCGPDAGQTVPHLHFHVLGGKPLGEKII